MTDKPSKPAAQPDVVSLSGTGNRREFIQAGSPEALETTTESKSIAAADHQRSMERDKANHERLREWVNTGLAVVILGGCVYVLNVFEPERFRDLAIGGIMSHAVVYLFKRS